MKLGHFEKLRPLCPVCRRNSVDAKLDIGTLLRENRDTVMEGILVCSNRQCFSEYPVIDGIPIIVADLRTYVSTNMLSIFGRNDLTAVMESLIGDCCGPGSAFDACRQNLSTYAFDHYGDLDPEEGNRPVHPGSVLNLVGKGMDAVGKIAPGPVIDVGCAAGRTSFTLAEKTDDMVLGVDLNFDMLRTAARVLRDGIVTYPRRRVGIVYDRREFPVNFTNADHLDFWACDAMALPFADDSFHMAASFNVLDCVGSPRDHLSELARVLAPAGKLVMTTPYDWSVGATPVESWLGGHSQRSENKGASEPMIRTLLKERGSAKSGGFRILSEIDAIPWSVRVHDRGVMEYLAHMVIAELSE